MSSVLVVLTPSTIQCCQILKTKFARRGSATVSFWKCLVHKIIDIPNSFATLYQLDQLFHKPKFMNKILKNVIDLIYSIENSSQLFEKLNNFSRPTDITPRFDYGFFRRVDLTHLSSRKWGFIFIYFFHWVYYSSIPDYDVEFVRAQQ